MQTCLLRFTYGTRAPWASRCSIKSILRYAYALLVATVETAERRTGRYQLLSAYAHMAVTISAGPMVHTEN